jgi:TPR repeat protein
MVKAARLFQLAADQGHLLAQGELGRMYATGDGVKQDCTKAALLWKKGAEQGDAKCAKQLSLLLDRAIFPAVR